MILQHHNIERLFGSSLPFDYIDNSKIANTPRCQFWYFKYWSESYATIQLDKFWSKLVSYRQRILQQSNKVHIPNYFVTSIILKKIQKPIRITILSFLTILLHNTLLLLISGNTSSYDYKRHAPFNNSSCHIIFVQQANMSCKSKPWLFQISYYGLYSLAQHSCLQLSGLCCQQCMEQKFREQQCIGNMHSKFLFILD